MNRRVMWILMIVMLAWVKVRAADSLPPLKDGKAPTNLVELWGNYDPRKEPLEAQVVREWKEGDNTYRSVVFMIGTFKGKKARLAAFYAFPKSDRKLPAILQVHGGGQRASVESVKHSVDNGYVGLSINWGGWRRAIPTPTGAHSTPRRSITTTILGVSLTQKRWTRSSRRATTTGSCWFSRPGAV